jgi:hypothetical protein
MVMDLGRYGSKGAGFVRIQWVSRERSEFSRIRAQRVHFVSLQSLEQSKAGDRSGFGCQRVKFSQQNCFPMPGAPPSRLRLQGAVL